MRLHDVLLDEDDAGAAGLDARQRLVDVADHDRREAEADLVAQQQARVRHQRAADRGHLLLAAGERGAGLMPPLLEHREQREDRLDRPGPGHGAAVGADQQVLLDGQRRKQPPALGHQRDAEAHDLGRAERADRLAAEINAPGLARQQPGDGLEIGGLAGAVGADDRHGLALIEPRVDAEQRLKVAVESDKVGGFEERHGPSRYAAMPM